MKPAYQISFKKSQLTLIGELCAIQGQIEYDMQRIVRRLEGITPEEAKRRLSADGMRRNAETFISVVRSKCKDPELVAIANTAFDDMDKMSAGRADFVHAILVFDAKDGFSLSFGDPTASGKPVSVRTRNYKKAAPSALQPLRDRAARVSCAVAHIYFCLMMRRNDGQSPWRGRF